MQDCKMTNTEDHPSLRRNKFSQMQTMVCDYNHTISLNHNLYQIIKTKYLKGIQIQ